MSKVLVQYLPEDTHTYVEIRDAGVFADKRRLALVRVSPRGECGIYDDVAGHFRYNVITAKQCALAYRALGRN